MADVNDATKSLATWVAMPILAIGLHSIGYWQGVKRVRAGAVEACAREMTPTCTAVSIANMRQLERTIATMNRKPIVVECRR